MRNLIGGMAAVLALGATPAMAQLSPNTTVSINSAIGSLGSGPEADVRFGNSRFGVRLGANFGNLSATHQLDNRLSYNSPAVSYNVDVYHNGRTHFLNGGIKADYYPFDHGWASGFRVSAGIILNGDSVVGDAHLSGPVRLGYMSADASGLGNVHEKSTFNFVDPFVGIGYSTVPFKNSSSSLLRNLHVAIDAGVMYQGTEHLSLQASGGPALSVPQIQGAIQQERNYMHSHMNMPFYPVVQFSVGVQF